MIIVPVKNYKYGVISSVEDTAIPREAASASKNWLTKGSEIELRRGSTRLGLTDNTGTLDSSPSILNSYSETNQNSESNIAGTITQYGQSFQTTYETVLDSCKFYAKKIGSPTGNIYATVYAHTGTYGVNGTPTGSVLATSDVVDKSTLSSSFALQTFTFSGANKITLTSNTNYFLVITDDGVHDVSNFVRLGGNYPTPSISGNHAFYQLGTWTARTDFAECFYIYATNIVPTTGKITGGIVAQKADGTDVAFRSRGRKVEYYDTATEEWIEIGSDVLPVGADGEQITFDKITTVTGPQVWFNSPHAGLHKIMVANPGSVTAMYDATKNYRGYIKILGGAIWLWNAHIDNKVPDLVNIYRSYLANKATADFTQISGESIGGSGITRTGTLAFKAAGATRTCFEVTFTDGTETFVDNLSGVLVGSAGGTGTINYTTGDYSITFAVSPGSPVTATYRWENSNVAGLSDFTFSATRTSGQGFVLRQQDGGFPMTSVFAYSNRYYCMHTGITWVVSISADDLTFDNQIYRVKVGITSTYGGLETAGGIYYIDDQDKNDPQIRRLAFDLSGAEVLSTSISKKFVLNKVNVGIDLSVYLFDKAYFKEFGNLILVACRELNSTENNVILVINTDSWAIDPMVDYYANVLSIYNGAMIAGESISNNSSIIFSGSDDLDSEIDNYWDGKLDNLDSERLKNCKKIVLEGNIGPDQSIRVFASDDYGTFVEILDDDGTEFIRGDGSYVDKSQRVNVGPQTLGRGEVGGGGDGVVAYHYMREIKTGLDKFYQRKLRFKATRLGYASITQHQHKDIRVKWQKLPGKYR